MGISDRCPSKKETIHITVAALDSNYNAIHGTYDPPIKLSDTDTSGATHLSSKSVTHASQIVDLSYSGASIGSFNIIPSIGTRRGTGLPIAPHSACINTSPATAKVIEGGRGTTLKLSGSAKPPFALHALDPQSSLGCNSYVKIAKVGASSYDVKPGPQRGWGACAVFASSISGGHAHYFQINVLLIKP